MLFGGAGYLVPVALFGTGAVLVLRPMLPAVHPFRTGRAVPGRPRCASAWRRARWAWARVTTARRGTFDTEYLRTHGGLVGEGLFYATRTLFQEVGAHILFLFLMLAGLLLLTGASVAGIVKGTRESVASTTRRVRKSTGEFASVLRTERTRPLPPEEPSRPAARGRAGGPRHPRRGARPRTTRSRCLSPSPSRSPIRRTPSSSEEVDEEPIEEELTPMGNRRTPVTESDDLDYRLPRDKLPHPLQRQPEDRRQGRSSAAGARWWRR